MSQRLLPILSNRPEIFADRNLHEVATIAGDRLSPKVSLAEIIDIDDPLVRTTADRGFLLMASFDFVITRNNRPIFCVEIDGRHHSQDIKTIERDRKKDAACDAAGLPILRITTNLALQDTGKRSILKYVTDSFYLFEAFHDAQRADIIPYDEPFDRSSLSEVDSRGNVTISPDEEVASYLAEAEQAGRLATPMPRAWLAINMVSSCQFVLLVMFVKPA